MDGSGPEQALLAAIEMQQGVREFSEKRRKASLMPVDMGIGVHTGLASIGIVGVEGGMESMVLGDSVGIAAKMERLSKLYGLRLAISGKTCNSLEDKSLFKLREVDMVVIPGKETTLTIYDVYSADPPGICDSKQQNLAAHNEALELFRHRQWEKAFGIFSRLEKIMPFDRVSTIYAKRCQAFSKSPPGDTWVGVSRLSDF